MSSALALEAAAHGLSVIPVGADKVPLVAWKEFQTKPATAEQIEDWAQELQPWGWGIVTGGVSGLVVVDGDGELGRATVESFATPTVLTPSGGCHVYVEHPGEKTKNSVRFSDERPGLDVRGDGGYVVAFAPGYKWTNAFDPAAWDTLPEDVRETILKGKRKATTRKKKSSTPRIEEGQRNVSLFDHLRSVRRKKGADLAALMEAAERFNAKCDPPLDEDEVLRTVRSVAEYEPEEEDEEDEDRKQSQQLVKFMADRWEEDRKNGALPDGELGPFHDSNRDAWVRFLGDGGQLECHAVRSRIFKLWLQGLFFKRSGTAVSENALKETLAIVEHLGIFDGPEHEVHLRVAADAEALWVDLGDAAWRAVKILPAVEGVPRWELVGVPPVRFRRSGRMLPLPEPVRGGTLNDLRPFVNIVDAEWPLVYGWILSAYHPDGPHFIGEASGEYGTAKSTLSKILRYLTDPNRTMLARPPESIRDVDSTANNNRVLAFDNMSSLSDKLSDALCRVATGGGASERRLYANFEESSIDYIRPVLLNGISDRGLGTRGDFLNRLLVFHCPHLDRKIDEGKFWAEFEAAAPKILGGIFDAISFGLEALGTFDLGPLADDVRLGTAAYWITACEVQFTRGGEFLKALKTNQAELSEHALEASPLTKHLVHLSRVDDGFRGPAVDLLKVLNALEGDKLRRTQQYGWPQTPIGLGRALARLAPDLRHAGVIVQREQDSGSDSRRVWRIFRPGQSDASDASDASGQTGGSSASDQASDASGSTSSDASRNGTAKRKASDASDASDGLGRYIFLKESS